MNGYHDPTADDPRPPAGDRPVAGRPGHGEDLRTGEPAEAVTAGEDEHTGRGHRGEPFGTEEPMVVTEPEESEATPGAADETAPATETEAVTPPVEPVEPGAEPPAAPAEQAGEPVAEGARPSAADEFTVDRLLEPEVAERLRERWRDVKAVFVDDPADAVRQAGALTGEAVDELTAALGRLRRELDGARESDTERLRITLRGYGSLIDRILTR
jgi:hypothetical protein